MEKALILNFAYNILFPSIRQFQPKKADSHKKGIQHDYGYIYHCHNRLIFMNNVIIVILSIINLVDFVLISIKMVGQYIINVAED